MNDPQTKQPFGHFVGHHRRTVIGQQRPRQAAFLNRLRESVHEIFSRLREVPLQVATQPRVVIENAQYERALSRAIVREHLE